MKFEEVLPALREGKKIRATDWLEDNYIQLINGEIMGRGGVKVGYKLDYDIVHLMNCVWGIIEEPKKKKLYAYNLSSTKADESVVYFLSREKDDNGAWKRAPEYDLEF